LAQYFISPLISNKLIMAQDLNILYVEDNEDYIDFVKRAVKKNNLPVTVSSVTDGQKVVEYLSSQDETIQKANLILLDIHLPGIDGIELLKKLRKNEHMALVPVIMFSTSDNPADVKKCYSYGANAYVVKPMGIDQLSSSLTSIYNFWLNHNYNKNVSS
jgi:CheY-like chemotaxis protein